MKMNEETTILHTIIWIVITIIVIHMVQIFIREKQRVIMLSTFILSSAIIVYYEGYMIWLSLLTLLCLSPLFIECAYNFTN
jgi:hypothetical protein